VLGSHRLLLVHQPTMQVVVEVVIITVVNPVGLVVLVAVALVA
jgi:hypothetical protein